MAELVTDKIYYVVQGGYLKFPDLFKKRFGINTGMKLDESFPNPLVGVEEDKKLGKIQITYEFDIAQLKAWQDQQGE